MNEASFNRKLSGSRTRKPAPAAWRRSYGPPRRPGSATTINWKGLRFGLPIAPNRVRL